MFPRNENIGVVLLLIHISQYKMVRVKKGNWRREQREFQIRLPEEKNKK